MQQETGGGARRRMPVPHALLHRQDRLLPRERLADDAGEEARGGAVGLARPHADGRQADADAVEEAAPRIVGEQQLADRLLRAVAGERRVAELVADRRRKRRAEHGDRRGEHHARLVPVADFPDRLEQVARAVEVDAVAFLEVRLCFAGNDGRQVSSFSASPGMERSEMTALMPGPTFGATTSCATISLPFNCGRSFWPIMPAAPMTRIFIARASSSTTGGWQCARRRASPRISPTPRSGAPRACRWPARRSRSRRQR